MKVLTTIDLLALPNLETPPTGHVGFGAKSDGLYQKVGTVETKLSIDGHTHTFASLTSKPTTLAGYGITDALSTAGGTVSGELIANTIKINKTVMYSPNTETDIFNIRRYANDYTILNVWSPPQTSWGKAREATLSVVRGDNNEYFMDLYNMDYGTADAGNNLDYGSPVMGLRLQKRGTGVYTPFYFEYGDGINTVKALELLPNNTSGTTNNTTVKVSNNLLVGNISRFEGEIYTTKNIYLQNIIGENIICSNTNNINLIKYDINWNVKSSIQLTDAGVVVTGNIGIGTSPSTYKLDVAGTGRFTDAVTAPTFSGALSGNATTATTLQTARLINGTSFNGSADITTANWGTARTLTIGNTGKSVNGSANISWSLAEIGALPLTGGTLTGSLFISSDNSHLTLKDSNLGFVKKGGYNTHLTTASGFPIIFSKLSTSTISDANIVSGTLTTLATLSTDGIFNAAGLQVNGNNVYHAGNFTNLNQLATRNFSDLQNKPTTLSGYGITVSDVLTQLKTVDGAGSGLDADLLDGVHNGSLTANFIGYNNSANGYAGVQFMQMSGNNEAGDLPSDTWYSVIKMNHGDGDTYYNRALAFEFFGDGIYTRRRVGGVAYDWRKVAFGDSNVASATKLQTPRTLWGQSFDGTANVSGSLTSVTDITASGTIQGNYGKFTNLTTNYLPKQTSSGLGNSIIYDDGSNVGIRNTSPSVDLTVTGTGTNYGTVQISGTRGQGQFGLIQTNNHADFVIGNNLRIVNDNGHNLEIGENHPSISGSAITFGGNGANNNFIGANVVSIYSFSPSSVSSGAAVPITPTAVFKYGSVGIGTTSPSYKLDVSGTGRFTSSLTAQSLALSGAISGATTIAASTSVTAPTFVGALSGNASTATVATKLGTATVGGTVTPFYLNAGVPTAFATTVGSATLPVYMNAGSITACTSFGGLTGIGTATPLMDGTAAVGTSTLAARQDHIHPTDTSRAAVGQTMYIGTTAVAINRASATLNLTGIGSLAMGGSLTGVTTLTASTSVTVPKVIFAVGGWSVEQSGTEIQFKYNNVVKQRLLSDGSIVAVGEVTAYGATS